ncbi:MAG: Gfo/Idh/MocA family protein [Planctomycetaceae bacterium]
MTSPVKFGILGCGRIVERGLAPGLANSPDAELYAIASQRPGVAAERAAKYGAARAYDSYEALLADPDVQAVYVPCTGEEHHRWTIAAAEAGKHVLCEKPLARSVSDAEQMIAACADAGVVLQEAFMWRHHPRTQRAKELLDEGAIGELRLIVASFSFDVDRSDWRLLPKKGGGAMWDIGCYGVNCSRYFTGAEPIDIHAHARWWETGADMGMQIALAFPGDVFANIDCSFEAPFRCRAELVGAKGRIMLEDAFLPKDDSVVLLQRGTVRDAIIEVECTEAKNQYACQVTDFCRSIKLGRLQSPAENGLANMRVLEQVLASATGNRRPHRGGHKPG